MSSLSCDEQTIPAALVRGVLTRAIEPRDLPLPLLGLVTSTLLDGEWHDTDPIGALLHSESAGAPWVARTTKDPLVWTQVLERDDSDLWRALVANPAVPRDVLIAAAGSWRRLEDLVSGAAPGGRLALAEATGYRPRGAGVDSIVEEALMEGGDALEALVGRGLLHRHQVERALVRLLGDRMPSVVALHWIACSGAVADLGSLRTRRTPHLDVWLDALDALDVATRRRIVRAGVPANVLQRIDRDWMRGHVRVPGVRRNQYLPKAYLRDHYKMFPRPQRLTRRRARWLRKLQDADVCAGLLERYDLDAARGRVADAVVAHVCRMQISPRSVSSLARHERLHHHLIASLAPPVETPTWESARIWQHLAWHSGDQRARIAAAHPAGLRHAYLADMDPVLFRSALEHREPWTREWLDGAYTMLSFEESTHGRIGGSTTWVLDHIAEAGVQSLHRWHPDAAGAAVETWLEQLGRDADRWETLLGLLPGWQLSVRSAGTAARRLCG